MRVFLLCVVGLVGCGSVKNEPGQHDAATGDAPIACTIHDTIDSCGASCAKCPAGDDRQTPTCDGAGCGVTCLGAAPKCTGGACSRLTWAFDSNMLDGITPRTPAGLALAVRNHAGNLALAIEVADGQLSATGGVSVTIPICLTGSVQLQTKTLSASVYFDGGDPSNVEQYFLQGRIQTPTTGENLDLQGAPPRAFVIYSAQLSKSQFANTTTSIALMLGSFGAPFKGTVWLDDIKIQ